MNSILCDKDSETPLFDGLGSERTVTNGSGSGTGSLTLAAFGQTVTSSGSSASAYKFGATSGYRDDGGAGLVKVGYRYYDPETGRFTSRDTDLSQKAYVYCEGDPVNAVDPSGHDWQDVKDVLTGVLEGLAIGGQLGAVIGGAIVGYGKDGWRGAANGAAAGVCVNLVLGSVIIILFLIFV